MGAISAYHRFGIGLGIEYHPEDADTHTIDPFAVSLYTHQSHSPYLRHMTDSQGVPISPARTTSLSHQASSIVQKRSELSRWNQSGRRIGSENWGQPGKARRGQTTRRRRRQVPFTTYRLFILADHIGSHVGNTTTDNLYCDLTSNLSKTKFATPSIHQLGFSYRSYLLFRLACSRPDVCYEHVLVSAYLTSFQSLAPNGSIYTIPSQQPSSVTSPATLFRPSWPHLRLLQLALISVRHLIRPLRPPLMGTHGPILKPAQAVDIHVPSQIKRRQNSKARPPSYYSDPQTNVILAPLDRPLTPSSHPAKRRRSKPEPGLMKIKDVGLGVLGIAKHSEAQWNPWLQSTRSDG